MADNNELIPHELNNNSFGMLDIFLKGLSHALFPVSESIDDETDTDIFKYNSEYIDATNLPDSIDEGIQRIEKYDTKIRNAIISARNSKKKANWASSKPAGWFQKKEAIEALQESHEDLATAIVENADAIVALGESQKQQATTMKWLLGLGIYDVAARQTIVRQFELKLKGASEEELSEFTKQEMLVVVRQLKAQEDLQNKYDKLSNTAREQATNIDSINSKMQGFEKSINIIEQDFTKRIDELTTLRNNDIKNQKENASLLKQYFDNALEKQSQTLLEQQTKQDEINENQSSDIQGLTDQLIELRTVVNEKQSSDIQRLTEMLIELQNNSITINEKVKKSILIAYLIGGAGVISAISALLIIFL